MAPESGEGIGMTLTEHILEGEKTLYKKSTYFSTG